MSSSTRVSKRRLMCCRVERSHSASWCEACSSRILQARSGVMCSVVSLPLSGSMRGKVHQPQFISVGLKTLDTFVVVDGVSAAVQDEFAAVYLDRPRVVR